MNGERRHWILRWQLSLFKKWIQFQLRVFKHPATLYYNFQFDKEEELSKRYLKDREK